MASIVALAAAAPASAAVALDFMVSFDPSDDTHVQLRATHGYYQPSQPDLRRTAAVVATPDEMAVVFFIARHSSATVEMVLDRRSRGEAWFSIMAEFGIYRDQLYLRVPEDVGPPYGRAVGHRKHRKHGEPKRVALTDAEVVDLVNLQVVAGYYSLDPMVVIESRKAGKPYARIHRDMSSRADARTLHRHPEHDDEIGVEPMRLNGQKAKGKGHGKGGAQR